MGKSIGNTANSEWTAEAIPDLSGRTAVVTGANTGLGFETALLLAAHGAHVVMACRNPSKATAAAERIRASVPSARLTAIEVELSSLDSVRAAAESIRVQCDRIELLVNNAGTANVRRELSRDGFELTLATNHLGPFALTGLLLDRVLAASGARIVTVSSRSHARGVLEFDDLHFARRPYTLAAAYAQSKLAGLLFTDELNHRLEDSGAIAVAAHPGTAITDFADNMSLPVRAVSKLARKLAAAATLPGRGPLALGVNTAVQGALTTVRAATDPQVSGGEFYGPHEGSKGHPVRVEPAPNAHDEVARRRLWSESERLTGVRYPALLD
ncbi:SDR family NAD(P)-dependent oxidoreductase [Nocardia yamanashiensis]|uniref:oxidoreductase n=1 Tax=Nocardia yamanashiensis TaxID=209247 RepID=UPI001E42BBD1|nr:oxidoreductase [Nocardia yamanashiensis]UGT39966.1 SDR family NAD(P)-dependent oxidoreductase [Nocardia yamanashiensis]